MSPLTPLRTLQTLAVFSTTTLTGLTLSLSTLGVPLLLSLPTNPLLLRQWTRLRRTSSTLFLRTIPMLAGAPYLLLAYLHPAKRRLYILAAALCFCPLPYGELVMGATERKLDARARQVKGMDVGQELDEVGIRREETVRWLVDHWATLNLGRFVMIAGAGVAGLAASLGLGS